MGHRSGKSIISVLVSLILVVSVFSVPVAAETTLHLTVTVNGENTVRPGGTVTIEYTVKNTGSGMGGSYTIYPFGGEGLPEGWEIKSRSDDGLYWTGPGFLRSARWETVFEGKLEPGESVSPTIMLKIPDTARGTYEIKATLSYSNGEQNVVQTISVRPPNEPPNAEFSFEPSKPEVGKSVTFAAFASSDPNSLGFIETYRWDFNDDGSFDAEGERVQHTFSSPGTYSISLKVTDDRGASDTKRTTVTVSPNKPPKADFTYSPTKVKVGESIRFDGSISVDPNGGSVESYRWDFDGDGRFDIEGALVKHTFSNPGKYTVRLKVTDGLGASDTKQRSIRVLPDEPPEADFTYSPTKVTTQKTVTFNAAASTDPEDSIETYKWDFNGDGSFDDEGENVEYTFSNPGNHSVLLKVTDAQGQSDTKPASITVYSSPTAAIDYSPQNPHVRERITFNATNSTHLNGSIVTYKWDLNGDGSFNRQGERVTYAFTSSGTHSVTLKVIDSHSVADTATAVVYVGSEQDRKNGSDSRSSGGNSGDGNGGNGGYPGPSVVQVMFIIAAVLVLIVIPGYLWVSNHIDERAKRKP